MVILTILVGMALPALTGIDADARETALRQQLQRVRTQVDFYAFQHDDLNPGQDPSTGSWSASVFTNQLTLATDLDGNSASVGTSGYPYGPYLTDGIPVNPFNDLNTVYVVSPGGTFSSANDSTGWVYWADTGDFRANSSGATADGDNLFDL